ncbi:MAG TPA: hypothetical protein PK128_10550 [Bacillota bacterium]|nr:hypothetical protein [Bacillota bacterium]
MSDVVSRAREFILTHARLLERRLFEVHFEGADPYQVCQVVRGYQNRDGGLGHALEPDVRCSQSQPLFVAIGLAALEEVQCRDLGLAISTCSYLESVSDSRGLVACLTEEAYRDPIAQHWIGLGDTPGLNPTADLCGLLYFHGVEHEWLALATETCCEMVIEDPPLEAHTLLCVSRLAQYIPGRKIGERLLEVIADTLPRADYFIPSAPVERYGLTPLHFAPKPDSMCRKLFSQDQIDGHLEDLLGRQMSDGGWPIDWKAPGPAAELEWRGRRTLDAICTLSAYGVV